MVQKEQYKHPIFNEHGIDEVIKRSGYKTRTVVNVATGVDKPTHFFRRVCSLAFERPEEELFTLDPEPAPSAGEQEQSDE